MTISVNEYTSQLPNLNYRQTDFDPSLQLAVASHYQKNYDRVLNTVRGLQSQALNIQMLNGEGRQRLDQYNKELNEKLSGDLGDLNKIDVQNQIAGYFQQIAGDTQLIKASQLSGQYQNQIDLIESYRQSGRKDRGYNSINETVFREWDGGLNDFMNSSLSKVTNPNFQPTRYTPFKELDTKLLNIAKTLHADTTIKEGMSGSEGYLLHKEVTGVSPEKIREMMLTQFDQEDLEQLDVLAKYEVIKNRQLNSIPDFYNKYNTFADNEISRTESQGNTLKQQAEYYQSLINDSKTPADKKAEYTQIVNQLLTNSNLYSERALSLRQTKKQLSDFEKMSNNELLEYAKEMQWYTKVNGLSDALSWKKEVETIKLDQVWKVNKEIDAMRWREELRASTKLASDKIRAAAKGKTLEQPQFSGPIDSVKNTQSFFDSYKTLTDMSEQMGKITDKIITSPSFNKSQLLDESFLQKNKDNYEVKMWDIFRREYPNAIKSGQPQVEAFKLWLADQESNPEGLVGQHIQEFNRNKLVSDYLDKQVHDINQVTRKEVNEYDLLSGYPMYKQDGSPLSREEYNAGVPAYIGVPRDKFKSSFSLVRLDDALNEIQRGKKFSRQVQQGENQVIGGLNPVLGVLTPIANSIDSDGSNATYKGYLETDPGLVQALENLNATKNNYNAQLESEMVSRLPQIFQIGMVEALNEEAINLYMNDVVSAAKNSNAGKNGQFAISLDDISFMRIPIGGTKGQFGLKPGVAEKYEGWKLPDAADPTKLVDIKPGNSFAFTTNRPYMPYDILFNEVVTEMPVTDKYKGYTTTIQKSKLDNSMTITVTDKNGQKVAGQTTTGVEDVNAAIRAMRQFIDTQSIQKK